MADHCPHCGAANPENLPFCNDCGEPIDSELQLIMEVKKTTASQQSPRQKSRYKDDIDEFELDDEDEDDEKKFPVLAIVFALAIVACVVILLVR